MMDVETASLRVWNGCELEEGWLVNKGERWRVMVLGVDEEKVVIMMLFKQMRIRHCMLDAKALLGYQLC